MANNWIEVPHGMVIDLIKAGSELLAVDLNHKRIINVNDILVGVLMKRFLESSEILFFKRIDE